MDALLALVPWYYRWLAIAIALAAAVGFGFMKGVEFEEGELDKVRHDIDVERAGVIARQAERKRLSDADIKKRDDKRETDLAGAHRWWADYVARLCAGRDDCPGAQPIRKPAPICNDAARDAELQGAIDAARRDTRAALAEYRRGIGSLLSACEVQTGDLVDVQDWAQHQQLLNAAPK